MSSYRGFRGGILDCRLDIESFSTSGCFEWRSYFNVYVFGENCYELNVFLFFHVLEAVCKSGQFVVVFRV